MQEKRTAGVRVAVGTGEGDEFIGSGLEGSAVCDLDLSTLRVELLSRHGGGDMHQHQKGSVWRQSMEKSDVLTAGSE